MAAAEGFCVEIEGDRGCSGSSDGQILRRVSGQVLRRVSGQVLRHAPHPSIDKIDHHHNPVVVWWRRETVRERSRRSGVELRRGTSSDDGDGGNSPSGFVSESLDSGCSDFELGIQRGSGSGLLGSGLLWFGSTFRVWSVSQRVKGWSTGQPGSIRGGGVAD
ncbi:uncharacterized protein LOC110936094 isoform X2 [Helianthus annuus]|uniref:uncharacterized protein LOC110936094 isoform X2 n=1 Tax=Helianthus annuus TaxID=4232 RepID=UPI001652C22B|nr:uncharacterized protein LOC110936094 isoform X2 [Helianthus annuus]